MAAVPPKLPGTASLPGAETVTHMSLATSGTGATYVAFGAGTGDALSGWNTTGVALEYRRGGAGVAVQIPVDAPFLILLPGRDATTIGARRVDQSNTPVTLTAELLAY